MNKLALIAIVTLSACIVRAEDIQADYTAGEKSASLVSPEVTVAASAILGGGSADLMNALHLQMAKYDRDMLTPAGRQAWHGKLVKEEIYAAELVKVEVYSNEIDGVIWRFKTPFKPVAPKTVAAPVLATNGVPARLAAARAKRAAELAAGTQTVTVTVTADGRSQ
jgi:hypothetical protein